MFFTLTESPVVGVGQVVMETNSDVGATVSKFDVQSGQEEGGEGEEGGGEGWEGEGDWGGDWDVVGEGDNEEGQKQKKSVEDTFARKEEEPARKVKGRGYLQHQCTLYVAFY